MGTVSDVDLAELFDRSKSLDHGAITVPGYTADGWQVRIFGAVVPTDVPIADFSDEQLQEFLYGGARKVKLDEITTPGGPNVLRSSRAAKDLRQPTKAALGSRMLQGRACAGLLPLEMTLRRRVPVTWLILALSTGCDEPPSPGEAPEDGEIVEAVAGELIELEDGIQVEVPPPGDLVMIEVMYDDGNTAIATIVNDPDHGVRVEHPDEHLLGLPPGTAASCASKCSDSAYSYVFGSTRAKWKSRLNWHYRHGGSPVGKNAAINAFKHGAQAVPKQRNSCSMSDQSNATHRYEGETSTRPNIGKDGSNVFCKSPDGENVVGWGGLPDGTLAVTCSWASDDGSSTYRIIEADQRYDTSNRSWFTGNAVPNDCSGRFSLRAVATHEFGHAYGLGHTPNACKQVMADSASACTSRRKFGRGDVRGVRDLY